MFSLTFPLWCAVFYELPRNRGDANNSQRTPILSRSHAKTSIADGGTGPSCKQKVTKFNTGFLWDFQIFIPYFFGIISKNSPYPRVFFFSPGPFVGSFHKEHPLYELGCEGVFTANDIPKRGFFLKCPWMLHGFIHSGWA